MPLGGNISPAKPQFELCLNSPILRAFEGTLQKFMGSTGFKNITANLIYCTLLKAIFTSGLVKFLEAFLKNSAQFVHKRSELVTFVHLSLREASSWCRLI